jgi:hypothetical protein
MDRALIGREIGSEDVGNVGKRTRKEETGPD